MYPDDVYHVLPDARQTHSADVPETAMVVGHQHFFLNHIGIPLEPRNTIKPVVPPYRSAVQNDHFGSRRSTRRLCKCAFTHLWSHKEKVESRARYYNPTTGRFLKEDPIGFNGSGPNLYAYADGNPVNFSDPSGLETIQIGVGAQGTAGGLSGTFSGGLAFDSEGNVGIYGSFGVGGGLGAGGSVGLQGAYSNGQNINDLSGPFGNLSLGGGLGANVSGDLFTGPSDDGYVTGGGGTLGLGGGVTSFAGGTGTVIIPLNGPGGLFGPGGPFGVVRPNGGTCGKH